MGAVQSTANLRASYAGRPIQSVQGRSADCPALSGNRGGDAGLKTYCIFVHLVALEPRHTGLRRNRSSINWAKRLEPRHTGLRRCRIKDLLHLRRITATPVFVIGQMVDRYPNAMAAVGAFAPRENLGLALRQIGAAQARC